MADGNKVADVIVLVEYDKHIIIQKGIRGKSWYLCFNYQKEVL